MIFELDAKLVVDTFHSSRTDIYEIRYIISCCKDICLSFDYVNIYFVKRQTNEVVMLYQEKGV